MMMSATSLGLRHQFYGSVRTLHGLLLLGRTCARHRPGNSRMQTRSVWQHSENPRQSVPEDSQGYKFLQNRSGLCSSKLFNSVSMRNLSPSSITAYDNSEKTNPSAEGSPQSNDKKGASGTVFTKLVKYLVKAIGGLILAAILVAAALPSFLSWLPGRRTALSLANKMIPGTVSVSSMSLGWTRPVLVEGFSLQGIDGEKVLFIPKVETKAPLWSIALGKSGLGDCTVTSPVVDLQQHPKNDLPRLALAVSSAETLRKKSTSSKKPAKQVEVPASEASLTIQVNAPKGSFQVTDGKLILPSDLASVLGNRLIVDVNAGVWATKESNELEEAEDKNEGLPFLASFWSDSVQAEAVGFLQQKLSKLKLLKPLKAEMDLTPAVAKRYLVRINPLLGEIVGPAIQDEDMPDVVVHVTPTDFQLPADHYKIDIAPMKVTLARGQVVDGILSLLSKQDLAKGKRNLTMQTSAIQANVDMPSSVECSRLDILIADKVHVATWGRLDWIAETVQMTLAIPGKSLRDLMGLTKVPAKYYLQIPVGGTLEKPLVQWKTAGMGIAELTARQRGGQLMQGFFNVFDSNDKSKSPAPEPIAALPWETNAAQ